MGRSGELFLEARRRRVFRVAALYIVGAWVILQVCDLAFEAWGVPDRALRYVWIGAVLAFPLALIFGWRYDVTGQGIVRTLPRHAGEDVDLSLHRVDHVILTALVAVAVAITYGLVGEIRTAQEPEHVGISRAAIQPNSIAVLPLANLSGDPEQAYFVEGMHDALITGLSQIGALRVTSRTSALQADTGRPMPAIGRELGVATLIEGSVYRVNNTVRITVQLIEAETDQHLWADSYERNTQDVLALQNDVARAVAEQVHVALTPHEEERLGSATQVDPEVYELYQQGLFQLRTATPEGLDHATELLERAVAADPGFARAWAALGKAHGTYGMYGDWSEAHSERARSAATEALKIDPDLAEAYLVLGWMEWYDDGDWEAAQQRVLRALELNPSLAEAHQQNAWWLMETGRAREATAAIQTALELDPLNIDLSTSAFAPWYFAREYDRALEQLDRSRVLRPEFDPWRQVFYGRVYAQMGRYDESLAAYESGLGSFDTANEYQVWTQILIAQTYAMAGRSDDARAWLGKVRDRPDGYAPPVGLAMVHASLGEVDTAIDLLEQAYELGDGPLGWLRSGPSFDRLRSHPRFQSLLAREGVPQPSATRVPTAD